jgi:D-sedoheptulose 7-phosphate isomerase
MNQHLQELLGRYPHLERCVAEIEAAFELLRRCYERDGVVYLCGNGGSAADADHIVGELMKSFLIHRKIPAEISRGLDDDYLATHLEGALRAIALTGHGSLATAFANDVEPDLIFAQQVFGYGRSGDLLWALSTSGNSRNVLHALKVARARGMATLGMTGRDGGAMTAISDVCIRVPESETHKVQELHLPVYHTLCLMLEARFFSN